MGRDKENFLFKKHVEKKFSNAFCIKSSEKHFNVPFFNVRHVLVNWAVKVQRSRSNVILDTNISFIRSWDLINKVSDVSFKRKL